MQLQIVAKPSVLCCHLANISKKVGILSPAIPLFAKLFLVFVICTVHISKQLSLVFSL